MIPETTSHVRYCEHCGETRCDCEDVIQIRKYKLRELLAIAEQFKRQTWRLDAVGTDGGKASVETASPNT